MFKISPSLVQNDNNYRNGHQVSFKKIYRVHIFSGALVIKNVSGCQQNVLCACVQQINYNRTGSNLSPFSGFFCLFVWLLVLVLVFFFPQRNSLMIDVASAYFPRSREQMVCDVFSL